MGGVMGWGGAAHLDLQQLLLLIIYLLKKALHLSTTAEGDAPAQDLHELN